MPTDISVESRSERLYPGRGEKTGKLVRTLVDQYRASTADTEPGGNLWSERDVVLITYADQLRSTDASPLSTLASWLESTGLLELFSVVHLLPFYPYSSDDGFAVIDFLRVDPSVGDWDEVARLGERVDLMFDLVLNHVSSRSEWFQNYLSGEPPYDQFFIEADPSLDYRQVVRPRSLPLLTSVETSRGRRHVWTTFSEDQIDLNYANPDVLVRMLQILMEYAQRGARIIRLDAVAFLWKELGTSCLHLPETHEVVKLMREVVGEVFPGTLLLTETNVPHDENVSYFGNGDEAHMVYQFSLPPLVLDAFVNGDAEYLRQWLEQLAPPPPGCTFFNFTASHDGIGVRPLEGLVPQERLDRVVEAVKARGGFINTRRQADGNDVPYELNITYVDALSPTADGERPDTEMHVRRFLTSQAVMLSLPGVPAVYFHSLVGTENDHAGVTHSGIHRRINRRKYELNELGELLSAKDTVAAPIYAGYRRLLEVRHQQPAFHPDALLRLLHGAPNTVLALVRTCVEGSQRVLVAANFGGETVSFRPAELSGEPPTVVFRDLLSGRECQETTLVAGGFVWLELR